MKNNLNSTRQEDQLRETVKKLRMDAGLTQENVANMLHIERSTYAYYETGRSSISVDILRQLAEFYKIPLQNLLPSSSSNVLTFSEPTPSFPEEDITLPETPLESIDKDKINSVKRKYARQEHQRTSCVHTHAAVYDVVIYGCGCAAVAAAVAAVRTGAVTLLVVPGSSLEDNAILPLESIGITDELADIFCTQGHGLFLDHGIISTDKEYLGYCLENLCVSSKVKLRYCCQITDAAFSEGKITSLTLSYDGNKESIAVKSVIDASENDWLTSLLACRTEDNLFPDNSVMLHCAVALEGLDDEQILSFCQNDSNFSFPQDNFTQLLSMLGVLSEGDIAELYPMPEKKDQYLLSYCTSLQNLYQRTNKSLSPAYLSSRDCFRIVDALRSLGGIWGKVHLVRTVLSPLIPPKKHILGIYTLKKDNVFSPLSSDFTLCHIAKDISLFHHNSIPMQGFDVPVEALTSADISNLYMAGPKISADSYIFSFCNNTENSMIIAETLGNYCGSFYSINAKKK